METKRLVQRSVVDEDGEEGEDVEEVHLDSSQPMSKIISLKKQHACEIPNSFVECPKLQ